ncbi:hypothetical protein FB451DRAFT_1398711 [Mycena latifolia]|nr:hypothetical protein FB451DRAFT_1398711 [Mycena latifolia]
MPSNRPEAMREIQTNPPQRYTPLSRYYIAASRASFGALCAFSRWVLRYYQARRASERTEIHARGLGVSIGSAGSEASYGCDSERSEGGIRAREGRQ